MTKHKTPFFTLYALGCLWLEEWGVFSSFLTRTLKSARAIVVVTKFGITCPDIFGYVSAKFGWVRARLKIFEAMVFKRAIGASCSLNVKMLDTINDGIVLSIEQNLVNSDELLFITDFVNQHNLSLLLDSERYFISTNALTPSSQSMWES